MGLTFMIAAAVIAILLSIFIAAGGFKMTYILYKTAPRDLIALERYLKFLYVVNKYSKRDLTVAEIFRENTKKNPNKVLFIFEDRKWTAKEVDEYSNKIANIFKNLGFKKGDCVALMMENRPEFVCIWLGLSKIGVISALINYNLKQQSLAHSVNVSNCSAFIFGSEVFGVVEEMKCLLNSGIGLYSWSAETQTSECVTKEWCDSLTPLIAEASSTSPFSQDKIGIHDKLVYIYTSGTTGLPKAAVITNSRYLFLCGAIKYQMKFRDEDIFYTPLPLYHTAGGAMSIGQAVIFGSTVVIRKKFSASNYFPDIVKYKCTVAQYIGEMCRYILSTPEKPEDKNHKLRIIFGNGLRPQIWKAFVTRFNIPKVGEFYGATEGNANIVNTDNTEGAIGFVSRIIPSFYPISIIKVNSETGEPLRNEKGLCQTCLPGEPGVFIGKIVPSNPTRAFLGYVNEKESEKKIVTDVFQKGDSAFLSGDIIVSDELGYLYFKDRTGDTFRWKGENVSTSEVEAVVSNVAQYRDCVVYGVEVPDTEGRAGMAAIMDEMDNLNLDSLADGLKKQLPLYAIPMFVRALHQVEMTGTFKLKKLDLQKEGFNPSVVKDKIYYLTSKGKYELLTEDIYEEIRSGKLRF